MYYQGLEKNRRPNTNKSEETKNLHFLISSSGDHFLITSSEVVRSTPYFSRNARFKSAELLLNCFTNFSARSL